MFQCKLADKCSLGTNIKWKFEFENVSSIKFTAARVKFRVGYPLRETLTFCITNVRGSKDVILRNSFWPLFKYSRIFLPAKLSTTNILIKCTVIFFRVWERGVVQICHIEMFLTFKLINFAKLCLKVERQRLLHKCYEKTGCADTINWEYYNLQRIV